MNTNEVTASIICPIRNEEEYIAECLESLVNQSYDKNKIEILVVDGMSCDKTREIVLNFQQRYKNIQLLDNPKKIVPVAMNIGIRKATGRYILRMDGHAKAASDYVENCLSLLDAPEITGVGGPITSINKTTTGMAIAAAMSSKFGVGNSRFRTSSDACFVDTVAFAAYKKSVFDKYGLFDEELMRCQDDEYNFRIRKFGGKILLSPRIKSWYFPRAGFRKLWKQYFGYGYWKIRVLQKHLRVMQPRQFVPALFVGSLLLSLILGLLSPLPLSIFIAIIILYLLASLAAAIIVAKKNKGIPPNKILISFYILHFAYGSGFIWGLIRFAPRWLRKKEL